MLLTHWRARPATTKCASPIHGSQHQKALPDEPLSVIHSLCATFAQHSVQKTKNIPMTRKSLKCLSLAERVGFEPTDPVSGVNVLAGRPVQPCSGTSPRWSLKCTGALCRSSHDPTISHRAEREGFEPPGLLSRPLSRRLHLSTLPPFRKQG